jgi:hypothetical protein
LFFNTVWHAVLCMMVQVAALRPAAGWGDRAAKQQQAAWEAATALQDTGGQKVAAVVPATWAGANTGAMGCPGVVLALLLLLLVVGMLLL